MHRVGGARIRSGAVQGAVENVLFVFHGSGTMHRQVRLGAVDSLMSWSACRRRIRRRQVAARGKKGRIDNSR